MDDLFLLSKRLGEIMGDMKLKDETKFEKRSVELSHWELSRLTDGLELMRMLREIVKR